MIPQKAIDLILEAEGLDQPYLWPGGQSGITIGYGYDLGYEKTFDTDWKDVLPQGYRDRLASALGLREHSADVIKHRFDDITIGARSAMTVFIKHTLPTEERRTLHVFPGAENLPPLAFGALVSLVYNRGGSMTDDPRRPESHTRSEMRAIREAVPVSDLKEIASQIRRMKRLWVGAGLRGLLHRREAEAALI